MSVPAFPCRPGRARRQRGVALVIALWITVLLTVIASSFVFDMRNEALAARNAVGAAQVRAVADGAIERATFELAKPVVEGSWKPDGESRTWTDGEVTVVASAVDETARIDLNTAPEPLLRSLFTAIGGVDDATAAMLVDRVIDWRDPDDLRRPNGAEEADYRAANVKWKPANAPFETVADLARVLGMLPEVYARVAPALTVYSRQATVNPATASREVLLALPNAMPEVVDGYLAQRKEALANRLVVPAFAAGQGFTGTAQRVWRIHAEATLPDGVTFVREAVVRPTSDPRHPFATLAWIEAPRMPAGDPVPVTASLSATAPDAARR